MRLWTKISLKLFTVRTVTFENQSSAYLRLWKAMTGQGSKCHYMTQETIACWYHVHRSHMVNGQACAEQFFKDSPKLVQLQLQPPRKGKGESFWASQRYQKALPTVWLAATRLAPQDCYFDTQQTDSLSNSVCQSAFCCRQSLYCWTLWGITSVKGVPLTESPDIR